MNNQLFIPLKLEETTIKGFEEMLVQIANKTIEEVKQNTFVKPYMNKKQAAEYIGISFNTLKKFEEEGLPIIEVAGVQMIRKADIDEFFESRRK
ncbi:hypothetical protein [Lysinibacillus capsici]|uniref:hypothetical protein n=1 Tax=Lysinibacillus capsici TaxID=2115968 RepID=UPI0034E56970